MPDEEKKLAVIPPQAADLIAASVRAIMAPVLESIADLLKNNTEAMSRIAAAQQLSADRIAALEKQVRLQTPMNRAQEKCVNDAVKARARQLLDPRGLADDKKAVGKLVRIIRKALLLRYGAATLRECPAYDYETILGHAAMWNDFLAVRDVVREARENAETDDHLRAGGAGPPAGPGEADQRAQQAAACDMSGSCAGSRKAARTKR